MAVDNVVRTVPLAHGQLSYRQAGSGAPVLIIHGIGGHKEHWRGVMEALSAHHTVYAIDMVGFGGFVSDAPEITIATQAAAVLALPDAESLPSTDLIGNSVGGWVAATFAAAHPDRVRRLALVDAAGFKAMFDRPSPVNFYPDNVADMQKLLRFVRHAAETQSVGLALDTTGRLPAASLAIGKAGLRSLALTLHPELAPAGIHAATVTIAGQIQPGTAFAPDSIAEAFWSLHADQPGQFRNEIVFNGTPMTGARH